MLTKEQILEVLKTNSSMYDGAVWPSKFGAVADALLKLQGAAPEGAIPEGYITEECPEGYVAKESTSCGFCALSKMANCLDAKCSPMIRQDGKWVIFIRKEDIR